jgi:calcineurin-like phosphoesterase family protein
MIYLYADPHFDHFNIIRLTKRPFSSVVEMNETLIRNYNAIVRPDDEVYILGDVAWKDPKKAVNILRRLNGDRKYLLIGNHDRKNLKNEAFRNQFVWAKDRFLLQYNKRLYVFDHFPLHSWDGMFRGSVNFHGHTHNRANNTDILRLDVGVDNPICSYAPISMEKVEALMNEKRRKLKQKRVEAKE